MWLMLWKHTVTNTILHLDVRSPSLSQLLQKYHKFQIRDYFNSVFARQAHLWQITLSLSFWTGYIAFFTFICLVIFFFLLVKTSRQAKTVHSNNTDVSSGLTDSSICLPCRHFIYQPEQNAGINLLHWTTETSPVPHPFDYHLIRILPNTWHNKALFVDASPVITATTQHSNKVKTIILHCSPLKFVTCWTSYTFALIAIAIGLIIQKGVFHTSFTQPLWCDGAIATFRKSIPLTR